MELPAVDGPPLRLPDPCLVVLVGATGAGKSEWARAWFHADQIVSADRFRAMVGTGERDQRASRDAFEVLDLVVAKPSRRHPTTVVDSTGLEAKRRESCDAEGRDPAEITVTHLAAARVVTTEESRAGNGAATVEEHVGRYRELAEAGVHTAIVGLSDADGAESVRRFGEVISAFAR